MRMRQKCYPTLYIFLSVMLIINLFFSCSNGNGGQTESPEVKTAVVTGTVTYNRIPVQGALVECIGSADDGAHWNAPKGPSTITDENGRFTLTDVKTGYQYISASKDGNAYIMRINVQPDSINEAGSFSIESVGSIAGYVRNQHGSPIESAYVGVFIDKWGFELTAGVNSEGLYEFLNIPEGTFSLTASADGYESSV